MRETPRLGGQIFILLCAIIGASFVVRVSTGAPTPFPAAQATTSLSPTTTSTTTKQPDLVAQGSDGSAQKNTTAAINSTSSDDGYKKRFMNSVKANQGMLTRTMYVLIGITAIILLYFGVRMLRLRMRRSKPKRYGVISTRGTDLEMTPLDQEDDEDDSTLFDVQHR